MNILLIGSGGREHALAWKIAQSPKLTKLYIAPGNAGTAELGENISIPVNDFEELGAFSIKNNIDFIVVGPEDPLVNGITDYFLQHSEYATIPVIGPGKEGAKLEGSKEYAKEFMQRNHIPTAGYLSVNLESIEEGFRFLDAMKPPYVLKADGLAAGKGVLILESVEMAKTELQQMLSGKFGEASKKVVIEEYLSGIEMSAFVITDGNSYKILPEAKDYKRIGEGDTGLNTGGMGCVSPVPFADDAFLKKVEDEIIRPTIEGLKHEAIPYTGFIFFGLMNCDGEPKVIEYNVRMGDPETEVIMPRLNCDLVEVFNAVAHKELETVDIEIKPEICVTVMLVSGGYPEAYEKGKQIVNIERVENSIVFHAGTKVKDENVVTDGGRVLALSSLAENLNKALEKSYENAQIVDFDGKYYRKDIGFDL